MTPKETMLFTGFSSEDFVNAKKVVSDSQIYNFSGNSICVPILEHIFSKLLLDYNYSKVLLDSHYGEYEHIMTEQLSFKLF